MPSNFLPELVHASQEYQEVWRDKDESGNIDQAPYYDMIDAEKTKEVENEVRVVVDQAIRGSITLLDFSFIFNFFFLSFYRRKTSIASRAKKVYLSNGNKCTKMLS